MALNTAAELIEDIRAASKVRAFVEGSGDAALKTLYNENVSKLARFRTRHLEYAASYINKQAGSIAGNDHISAVVPTL